MKKKDFLYVAILAILAVFIWLRNLTWVSSAEDSLPIIIAIPLFIWFGMPWRLRNDFVPIHPFWIITTVTLFLFGIALDLTFFLALGWTSLLWGWLSCRVTPEDRSSLLKLMILPIMAFPWVTLDADRIGWWFRLSGAWFAANLFTLFGLDVKQAGTYMVINGIPFSVEAACAGLNTLQSMIIAGVLVAYIFLKDTPLFWWNLPLLVVMAWLANTLRIITLSTSALIVSPEFALGAFHTWGGWFIILFMFAACWLLFSLQEPVKSKK